MTPFSCRYLCAAQTLLDQYSTPHTNPAEAAEEAAMRAAHLAFAVIEVWDGTTRVLVWKRGGRRMPPAE